jgi:hypothetical protein
LPRPAQKEKYKTDFTKLHKTFIYAKEAWYRGQYRLFEIRDCDIRDHWPRPKADIAAEFVSIQKHDLHGRFP